MKFGIFGTKRTVRITEVFIKVVGIREKEKISSRG